METLSIVEFLKKCSDAYYNEGSSSISDDRYDALVATLRRLDPTNPYLKEVGAPAVGNKVGRTIPMGTLSKYHTSESVQEWLAKENDTDILLSFKYDGFGIELIYVDGKLSLASTRGDGYVGDTALEAVQNISSVPKTLPDRWSNLTRVRGELIIPKYYHEELKALGYTAMRNAVPGIVKSNRTDALKYVKFVAYEFFDGNKDRDDQRNTYSELFNTENYSRFSSSQFTLIESTRDRIGLSRDTLDYEIDGVVLKTNTIKEDDLLRPAHQISWKWKSNRETTTLRDIEFSVGATGNISVVGVFDEVEFQGAKLRRASIGSLQRYEEMKPVIGDIVEVSRRGDIIPYIEEVALRVSCGEYEELRVCPCCGESLVDYRCVNKSCSDKLRIKAVQYVRYFNVKGIGAGLVNALIDSGIMKSLVDIYTMDPSIILSLPKQGKSAVEKWVTLQKKGVMTIDLLCAYPFENVGKSAWSSILNVFNIEDILENPSILNTVSIKGLGTKKISSIIEQLTESKEEIGKLISILNRR